MFVKLTEKAIHHQIRFDISVLNQSSFSIFMGSRDRTIEKRAGKY